MIAWQGVLALVTSVLGCFEFLTCTFSTGESCTHPKVEPSRTLSVHLSRERHPSRQSWDLVLCRFSQDFGPLFWFFCFTRGDVGRAALSLLPLVCHGTGLCFVPGTE